MHIQVVTFALQGLSDEEYQAGCEESAPVFAKIPGLVSKVWLRDVERGVYGGVKVWTDRQAMEAYLKGDIWRELVTDPAVVDPHSQDFGVIEGPTRVTRGCPAVLT
jgi:hypothetical protein